MTNAIEQTKREMYRAVAHLRGTITINYSIKNMLDSLNMFEGMLEDHLEELRKALVAGNAVIVDCAQHSAESFVELERKVEYWRFLNGNQSATINDLQLRLENMTEERDAIQLRLHAVDHAYREQQSKAGTSGQVCADRGASEQLGANMDVVMAAVRGAQDIMVEYLVPDGIRAKRAMTKLIPLLDNEKLYSALYELEHEKA